MSSEPTRREKILMGLRLAFALTEEEAEHMLNMHDTDVARAMHVEINEMPEPKVWSAPLKWWRKGRDAALSVVTQDILRVSLHDQDHYDRKGHKVS